MIIVPELDIFLNELILEYFSKFNPNKGLYKSAKIGYKKLIRYYINKGANDWELALFGAAGGGHTKLCKEFIYLYDAEDIDLAIYAAKRKGHHELAKFLRRFC